MKTVCIVAYVMSCRGGVEQVSAALANALVDHYHVFLLSLCMNGSLLYSFDSRVHFSVLFESGMRLRAMRKEAKIRLSAFFTENQVDVAIIEGNYPGYIASNTFFHTKTKLIFCDHGALLNQWDRKPIVYIRFLASIFCHKVVTLTERNRHDYIRRFLLPSKKVMTIPNWIDLSIAHSETYQEASTRIISAGRFGKEKGFDRLVLACEAVACKHPDWHLDLYGDGEMMDTVKALIEEKGLSSFITLWGMRSDLSSLYGEHAFYVLPSYREGLPLVLLEAKANRLPLVSYDIMTGPSEIIRDGIDGLLVKEQSATALGDAMCRLIENPTLRKSMSDRSQDTIDSFSKESIIKQWYSLIDSMGR